MTGGDMFSVLVQRLIARGLVPRKQLQGDPDPYDDDLESLILSGVPVADLAPEIREYFDRRRTKREGGPRRPAMNRMQAARVRWVLLLGGFVLGLAATEAIDIMARKTGFSRRTIERYRDR